MHRLKAKGSSNAKAHMTDHNHKHSIFLPNLTFHNMLSRSFGWEWSSWKSSNRGRTLLHIFDHCIWTPSYILCM